jgi:hypothetical protein
MLKHLHRCQVRNLVFSLLQVDLGFRWKVLLLLKSGRTLVAEFKSVPYSSVRAACITSKGNKRISVLGNTTVPSLSTINNTNETLND